jgi:hypothetical protein
MKIFIILLFLQACTTIHQPQEVTPPKNEEKQNIENTKPNGLDLSGCPARGSIQAADLSMAVDQNFLNHMREIGVTTIIRYGDYIGNETIRGKIARPAEMDLIKKNGFKFQAVFQHNNSKFSSFTATRGNADAEEMKKLFPFLSVWFYGVDFDASPAQQRGIEEYARAFKAVADKYGKRVGAYGSGRTLSNLFSKGLISKKWISQSTGFGGTAALTASGLWDMLQKLPNRKCGGKEFDPNVIKGDIGAVTL